MVLQRNINTPRPNSKPREIRKDSLPEGLIGRAHMRDTGCSLAPSCLRCPFNQCRYDEGVNFVSVRRMKQDSDIREMRKAGFNRQYVADHFSISLRSVTRANETKEVAL